MNAGHGTAGDVGDERGGAAICRQEKRKQARAPPGS